MEIKKKILLLIIIAFLSFVSTYLFLLFKEIKSIKQKIPKELTIEYGSNLETQLFNINQFNNFEILTDLSKIKNVGNYNIEIKINKTKFNLLLKIKDTTPPTLEVHDINIYADEQMPSTKEFITNVSDLSEYEIIETKIPTTPGNHIIEITAKDIYGNTSNKRANLKITKYENQPTFSGLLDINIHTEEKYDLYKNVTATSERFGSLQFTINDSNVNYGKEGKYVIYYQTEDPVGNITIQTRNIFIKKYEKTFIIPNFPTYNQFPKYPNGCESVALYLLLKYHKIDVNIEDIVHHLKKGKSPYIKNNILYGGNPEIEFVGDPRDLHGYGVFQKPIIEVAQKYKKNIIDYSGHSLDEVLEIVKKGIPVQVWVSIKLEDTQKCTSWIYPETNTRINWICNLHSVVIIGKDSNYIYTSDPYTGNIEKYNSKQFKKIYNLFGKRAIYYNK